MAIAWSNKGAIDLRHLPFVTIDPHDAKDFDDAVCMTEQDDKTVSWVAIADVAHYVQKDTRLDHAAKARATLGLSAPHCIAYAASSASRQFVFIASRG